MIFHSNRIRLNISLNISDENKSCAGMALIEVLIYISLISLLITNVISFMVNIHAEDSSLNDEINYAYQY